MHKYIEDTSLSYNKIAKSLKMPPSTVRYVIQRYLRTLSTKVATYKRNRTTKDPVVVGKVRDVKNNPTMSLRKRAQRNNISKTKVVNIMKKHGIKTFRKIKVPRRSDKQPQRRSPSEKPLRSNIDKTHRVHFDGRRNVPIC